MVVTSCTSEDIVYILQLEIINPRPFSRAVKLICSIPISSLYPPDYDPRMLLHVE